MNLSEYQQLAGRTRNTKLEIRDNLLHSALGAAGEAGEIANKVKKHIFHRHINERAAIIEEIGDVLWYLADLCTTLGVSLDSVAQGNIAKLEQRYPDGFSPQRSINREDATPTRLDTACDLDDEYNVYVSGALRDIYPQRAERLALEDYREGVGL